MTNILWKQPERFSFVADEWPEWRDEFMAFRSASGLKKQKFIEQRESLFYAMGPREAKKIAATFKYEGKFKVTDVDDDGNEKEEERDQKATDFDCVIFKLNEYFIPESVRRYERGIFNRRVQGTDEPFEEFLRDVQAQAKKCQYGAQEEEHILDKIVDGLANVKLKKELEVKSNLTLSEAIVKAKREELVRKHWNTERKDDKKDSKEAKVDEVKQKQKNHQQPSGRGRSRGRGQGRGGGRGRGSSRENSHQNSHQDKCGKCGYTSHKNGSCPAQGKRCRACNGRNHFESMCRKRPARQDEVQVQPSYYQPFYPPPQYYHPPPPPTSSGDNFLGAIECKDHRDDAWYVDLKLNGISLPFKIDTGADLSVLGEESYKKIQNKPILEPTEISLMSPGGRVNALGEFKAEAMFRGQVYRFKMVVIKGHSNLLSRNVSLKMGLVVRADEINQHDYDQFGCMATTPVKINLKDGVKPVCTPTARRIPFPLMGAVKEELDRMVTTGIIKPVTTPTDWCSPIVTVAKKDREPQARQPGEPKKQQVRICVDLKELNKAVRRPHYALPTLEDIAPRLAGSTVFSTLDFLKGFWQIPLAKESQHLTTFITPFGRFYFTRLPFGINLATDEFQRKMMEIFGKEEGVEVIIDDVLVHGKDMEEHDQRLKRVLEIVKRVGLQLNKAKCKFRKSEVSYFGHLVGKDGLKPQPEKVKAISELQPPGNVSELRTILGMFNYLGKFLPNLSAVLKPITNLLKTETAWCWEAAQEAAFKKAKDLICDAVTLTYYDPKLPTTVSADSSSFGIGGVIMQDHGGQWKPVAFCSRTLTPAEQRYAMVEKECLALVWTCERFSQYLTGLQSFRLLTDHKPLVPIIGSKSIDQVPLRCQRLILRLMRFNPEIQHVPGKEQHISDCLSRKPLPATNDLDDLQLEEDVQAHVDAVHATWPATPDRKCQISRATEEDRVLIRVKDYISNGWPTHKSSVSAELGAYYEARGQLSMIDGIITHGNRIVIPASLQQDMLEKLHESHQGLTKCLSNATSSIWWPGMTTQLKAKIEACMKCRETRSAQRKEPLIPSTLPERPWQEVATDLFEKDNKNYIVVVDKYSKWIEIRHLSRTSTTSVVNRLKEVFTSHGIPELVQSDNGPQFSSREYHSFASNYGFGVTTSSPHFHQANGAAESAVKVAKRILSQADPSLALLNYRNTPHSTTGISPACALMGRRLRTKVPVLKTLLMPQQPDHDELRLRDERSKFVYKNNYDRRHGARPLPELTCGQPVLLRREGEERWTKPGIIRQSDHDHRTYMVHTPSGILRRNRIHLQAVPSHPYWPSEEPGHDEEPRHAAPAEAPHATEPPVAPTRLPVAAPPPAPPLQRPPSTRIRAPRRRLIEEI